MGDITLVSLIMPIRNEAGYIEEGLNAIFVQQYPIASMQILIADGMSTDDTREVVDKYATQHPQLQIEIFDNPGRIVPTGLNIGLYHAKGDVIIRVDGHTIIDPDYVSRCVEALAASGADNVGGPMRAEGETYFARAIARATSSRFGVGSAQFHYAEEPCWVDTVYMGAYRREVFDRIGLFDEELVRNQDDEFNFRLIKSGGKIWLDPKIRSTYYSRATLRALWKQYYEYGFWKVRVIQKHGRPASWRHLVPGSFVLALAASAIMSLVSLSPLWILLVVLPYISALLGASLWLAAKKGWQYAPLLPFAFATLHVAYGAGFVAGLAHFGFAKDSVTVGQSE